MLHYHICTKVTAGLSTATRLKTVTHHTCVVDSTMVKLVDPVYKAS